MLPSSIPLFFFFNDTATTEIYTLSLHDALPISLHGVIGECEIKRRARERPDMIEACHKRKRMRPRQPTRSEEHTSELQSPDHLVCRLLLEKKKIKNDNCVLLRTQAMCYCDADSR